MPVPVADDRASGPPRVTADDSSANLPMVGFARDALGDYIERQLGSPTWIIELSKQQIQDGITDALQFWSIYRPKRRFGQLRLTTGVFKYMEDFDFGLGLVEVSFVEPNPVPTELFYGNLIDPAPLFRTGLDEYDSFLRWRKTWARVTSIQPDWIYDEEARALYIHNPIQRYECGLVWHGLWDKTEKLPVLGAQWVKEYSLAKARWLYADVMNKYSGAIPGPIKDLQMDNAAKRTAAETKIKELEEKMKSMQELVGISAD